MENTIKREFNIEGLQFSTMWVKMSNRRLLSKLSKLNLPITRSYYFKVQTKIKEEPYIPGVTTEGDSLYPRVKPKYPPYFENSFIEPREAWKWYSIGQTLRDIPSTSERLKYLSKEIDKSKFGRKVWIYEAINLANPKLLNYQMDKTKTVNLKGLPAIYSSMDVSEDDINLATSTIEQSLLAIHEVKVGRSNSASAQNCNFDFVNHYLIKKIVMDMSAAFAHKHSHLLTNQLDEYVTVEASWDRYGIKGFPPRRSELNQESLPFEFIHKELISTYDCSMKADFLFRSELPLPEVLKKD